MWGMFSEKVSSEFPDYRRQASIDHAGLKVDNGKAFVMNTAYIRYQHIVNKNPNVVIPGKGKAHRGSRVNSPTFRLEEHRLHGQSHKMIQIFDIRAGVVSLGTKWPLPST